MPYKYCFLLVNFVATAFFWKKIVIQQNFQFEYLLLVLYFNIFYNNIVSKSKSFKYFFTIYKHNKKPQTDKHKKWQVTINICMEKQVTENPAMYNEIIQWMRLQSEWQVPG